MNSIKNNPYRTLGLLAGASAKEQNRRISRLKNYIEAEQEPPTDDFSFPVFGKLNRSVESIEDAVSKLNLDSDKMNAALFWFWNGNPITDEAAFDTLKDGNVEEAYQIWDKLVIDREGEKPAWRAVTEKNHSAFHNYFVLEMLRENGDKQDTIAANLYFLESEYSEKFISTIADSTYKTNSKELQINFLNEIFREMEQGSLNLTLFIFITVIKTIDFSGKADFLKNISQKLVTKISKQIESSQKKQSANTSDCLKIGEELCNNTKADLWQLKSIVGEEDFVYYNIADKVAIKILECGINDFNEKGDNINNKEIDKIVALLNKSKTVAVGKAALGIIEDNLATITSVKIYNLCYYCGREMADANSGYKKNIYKVTSRYNTYDGRRMEYRQAQLLIPRCKKCKEIHKGTDIEFFILPLVSILFLLIMSDLESLACILVGGILGVILAAIIRAIRKTIKVKNENIKTAGNIDDFQPWRQLQGEGWTAYKPEA